MARGLPAALTLACTDDGLGRTLAEAVGYRNFRLYWSGDLVGVQLGGAIKNVLAIAAGIVDGKGLGASAHAALVTRGFAEMRRLGAALGAWPETLAGLSGLGDLVLTCGSPQSRNMSLGRALGQGQKLADVLGQRRSVAEGVYTAAAVVRVADEKGVEMPIAPPPSTPSSRAHSTSTRRSRHCCPARSGQKRRFGSSVSADPTQCRDLGRCWVIASLRTQRLRLALTPEGRRNHHLALSLSKGALAGSKRASTGSARGWRTRRASAPVCSPGHYSGGGIS